MYRRFVGTEHRPTVSSGLIEALWDTLVTLAVAAAICVAVISLSVHLNEMRIARAPAAEAPKAAAATMPASAAKHAASQFN